MKKHIVALLTLLILMFCTSCGVDFKADRPTIWFDYDDYLLFDNDFSEYRGNLIFNKKYIIEKIAEERKDITHISIKSSDDENVLLQFDITTKSYNPLKYRCFDESDNMYLFLDVWEMKQGYTNMIDGHIDSYIIYFNGNDITYEKTPDNAVPLLIKDGWLYAYSKLQFLKIDMKTGDQEVLYKLPFEGEFPPYTPWRNDEEPEYPDLYRIYKFIISADQIAFKGVWYSSNEEITFCTIDIS